MASGGVEVRFNWMTSVLQSGEAFSVIALWLGHESTTTTHRYVEANLEMKQKALAGLQEPDTKMSLTAP
jgi:integrase